jgi:hypothetical protein
MSRLKLVARNEAVESNLFGSKNGGLILLNGTTMNSGTAK